MLIATSKRRNEIGGRWDVGERRGEVGFDDIIRRAIRVFDSLCARSYPHTRVGYQSEAGEETEAGAKARAAKLMSENAMKIPIPTRHCLLKCGFVLSSSGSANIPLACRFWPTLIPTLPKTPMIMPRGAPHAGNGLHSGTNVEFVEVLDMALDAVPATAVSARRL